MREAWTGRCLHLMHAEKFIGPFVAFINERFESREHLFLVRYSSGHAIPDASNVQVFDRHPRRWGRWHKIWLLATRLNRAEKIFLHSLFHVDVMLVLLVMPWLLGKCHWLIWGADVYAYTLQRRGWRARVSERVRASIIRRVGYLLTYIPGDVALARQWYGAGGDYRECLLYPSNVWQAPPSDISLQREVNSGRVLNIIVGNSADPANNHEDAFLRIQRVDNGSFRIYCPLSYGDKGYADRVAAIGRELFGDRFFPLVDFMSLDQYRSFLASMDVAVFAHQRQQGLGNMIQLLGLGKIVFMRSTVTQYEMFRSLGVAVFDLDRLDISAEATDIRAIGDNCQKISDYFNIKNLERQYRRIFG